jgi:hypothetical protein
MFRSFSGAFRDYREGNLTSEGLVAEMSKTHLGRTPNPQRICVAIAFANIIGPIIMSMMQPPGVWIPIPLPAFCTTPAPTDQAMSLAERGEILRAVVDGLTD